MKSTIAPPAEWAPHKAVWIGFPSHPELWEDDLDPARAEVVAFARAVHAEGRGETVILVAADAEAGAAASAMAPFSEVVVEPFGDIWLRDTGPIVLGTGEARDFGFNGWGGKYGYELDDQLTRRLYAKDSFGEVPLQTVDLVLEGGSIEVDGSGTLLTTARCLLAPTRNPKLGREQLEKHLMALLGINRILWLHHGYLAGDDTDSHIDTLARFCDRHTIAYVRCDDPQDEHHAELKAMEAELKTFRATDGRPYRLVPLPWPCAKHDEGGQRLPATYANFLIINGAVLVPTYDDPADHVALARLKECFPDRELVAINCLPLIHQFGSLHCITMQLPEGVL